MVRKLDYPIKHMVQGEQIWDIKQGSEAVWANCKISHLPSIL
jgi:hypothetical protein